MIDEVGYAYYAERRWIYDLEHHLKTGRPLLWYWDDNQYDFLVESAVTKIEILELKYGKVNSNMTTTYDGIRSTSVLPNPTDRPILVEKTLEMSTTSTASWTHPRQFGVLAGSKIKAS